MRQNSIVSIVVMGCGIAWQFGMPILSWIGRMFDLIALGDYVTDLQLYIINNPNLAGQYGPWVLIWGGLGSLVAVNAGPAIYRKIRSSPLEIVYDPADKEGQFGGVGDWYFDLGGSSNGPPIQAFIFRVGVKNNTKKTIYNVTGTIEGEMIERSIPVALRFSRTRKLEGNIDPERMLLMDVFGMSPNPKCWPEGINQIIIRINGKDTPEAMARFYFDKSRMPAMYAGS